ncbi:SEC-C domain-containing protein [Geobacter sp. AOG2]|uniref:SEC-C domain-containing protein n=1 Tax=Geobacter sp. AOG2 TaxID=1566347 RepID=UPI001CC535A5|nr:SEC-C domain-containing protein [Geobacter sp. AOG2]GFE61315.1 hypothetical protein AOG2_19020 [Geobacter sp. AOG2]
MELTASKRLREAFSHWVKAAESYKNSDEFVIYLNACIQALRNVTFALQSEKSKIHNFEDWYALWQQAMAKDTIMIWCRDARNQIVKQSDLETKSVAIVSIHNNYLKEPSFTLEVNPLEKIETIGKMVVEMDSSFGAEKGYLKVERRWIDKNLESIELLSALAHAFTVLIILVNDIDDKLGPDRIYPIFDKEKTKIEPGIIFQLLEEYTPSCMQSFEDYRTEWLSIPDLKPIHLRFLPLKMPAEILEAAKERYGSTYKEMPDSFEGRFSYFLETAKQLLEADGYHMTVVFMVSSHRRLEMVQTNFRNQEDKYLFWQNIAKKAKQHGIKEVFFVGEAWNYSVADKIEFGTPDKISDKQEILAISGLSSLGECRNVAIPFRKINGKCVLGPPQEDKLVPNFFVPVQKIWGIKRNSPEVLDQEVDPYYPYSDKVLTQHYLHTFEPGPKDSCLCGSGQKFKNCCRGLYSSVAMSEARKAYACENYKDALRAGRLHLTWYLLCHRAHTVPLIKTGADIADKFITMDVDALTGIIQFLKKCYDMAGNGKDYYGVLKFHSKAVEDQRWYDEIAYLKALYQLEKAGNIKLAYKELKKISDLETTTDIKVLNLYLQLVGEQLTSEEKISIIDRILDANPEAGTVLHYQTMKAMLLYVNKDVNSAINLLHNTIASFKQGHLASSSSSEKVLFADCLYYLGTLTDEENHLNESLMILTQLQESSALSPSDLARAYFILGELNFHIGKFTEARRYFIDSIAIEPSPVGNIFIAKASLALKNFEEANEYLTSIDIEKLDDGEKLDFVLVLYGIATATSDSKHFDTAKKMLMSITKIGAIYMEMRNDLLSRIGERV